MCNFLWVPVCIQKDVSKNTSINYDHDNILRTDSWGEFLQNPCQPCISTSELRPTKPFKRWISSLETEIGSSSMFLSTALTWWPIQNRKTAYRLKCTAHVFKQCWTRISGSWVLMLLSRGLLTSSNQSPHPWACATSPSKIMDFIVPSPPKISISSDFPVTQRTASANSRKSWWNASRVARLQ